MNTSKFKNHIELIEYFKSDKNTAIQHLEDLRWNGKPHCPHCGSEKIYSFKDSHTYKCANNECYKKFTVTVGTIFENSKVPLYKWFATIYIFTSHKKGISSHQLAKDLSLSQKTTWLLIHKVREMLKCNAPDLLGGTVEIDETYIGGKIANKHKKERESLQTFDNKTAVLAILQRDPSKVFTKVIEKSSRETILPVMRKQVINDSTIYTDSAKYYRNLKLNYVHSTVNHDAGEYARGIVHTNTIEGYFSHLKRGILGIYHHVSPKHLQAYCNEFSFRYETRKCNEIQRYELAIQNCWGKRLTWDKLTGK